MKDRRTKEQKLKAKTVIQTPVSENAREPILQNIPLIKKDLRKTLVISLVLATILVGIYLYLG